MYTSSLHLLQKICLCTYDNKAFHRTSYFTNRFIVRHVVSQISAQTSGVAKGPLVGRVFGRFDTKPKIYGEYALLYQLFVCKTPAVIKTTTTTILCNQHRELNKKEYL